MSKPIVVIKESPTGRKMSRPEFVKAIKSGKYPDYHTGNMNGVETPASNPEGKKRNNLG